jgi:hypothetical protein
MSGRIKSSSAHSAPLTDVTETARELRHCPSCDCNLVQPHDWVPARNERWRMTLVCPNCQRIERDVFSDAEVALFEKHVDEGVTMLIDDLRVLADANRAYEIERFGEALSHDLLLPEDF